jgi:hypothetical protein
MNLCFLLFLSFFALVQAGYYASDSPFYHSCPCPDSITLETSSFLPHYCKFNKVTLMNQVQDHPTSVKPGRELTLWLAQICGISALIAFQLATIE